MGALLFMTFSAASLSARLHAGHLNQQGEPYLDHVTAVVTLLRERWPDAPDHAIEAAWLHDAMGRKGVTPASLLRAGISPEAVRLIGMLTRLTAVDELEWAEALAASGDLWAIRIKLADFAHNSPPARARLEAAERTLRGIGLR
ncbi:HD domain-containing protein [Roseomonas populi]|uniref:HD domain-containing protein n=1 Tax=Roseomonas populi TaxID=3121582 RepID=A0ABT1XAW2_9PROT|nr:HD domain-containing protein [Roseomonas pecuniae]MCR0985267.1 HD domain-containing protein [Roseomonas pecuniae]